MPSRSHIGAAARPRPLSPRPLAGRRTIDLLVLAVSAAIFMGGYLNYHGLSNAVDADEIVPVALLALRFGKRGGLLGAIVAVTLTGAWEIAHRDAAVTVFGYASRGVAFALAGIVLGAFIDQRRRLEAELLRYFDESPDLLATTDSSGYFTRVNPAWEAALGFTPAELCAKPFLDFVHPEDRPRTSAESAHLTSGSRDVVNFRNRYLTADGGCRWLEWNANAAGRDRLIHAAARDITTQVEASRCLPGTRPRSKRGWPSARASSTRPARKPCSDWLARGSTATTRPPAHRARRADVRGDRHRTRTRGGADRADPGGGAAARHRQARDLRHDPAEAGAAQLRGAQDDAGPCRGRQPAALR